MPEKIPPPTIQISRQIWETMLRDVTQRATEEACGILAGHITGELYQARHVFPTTNLLHSATRYRIDPLEQLAVFNQIDAQSLELVGIYHSHLNGPDHPSPTDIAEAYYPEVIYLIWYRNGGDWACAAYIIGKSSLDQVRIEILESPK